MKSLTIGGSLVGQRLDRALARLVPDLGLRGRRRLLEDGLVFRNGRPGRAADRLRAGDRLDLQPLPTPGEIPRATCGHDAPRLLGRQGELCFLYKPAGMHTVALAGRAGLSLEGCLPELLPWRR